MEVANAGTSQSPAYPLWSKMLAPRVIGKGTFEGHTVVAEAMHVTYQQQSTTFGRISNVVGISINGDGFTGGGGGFVDTTHKGVATIVFRDEGGAEQTHELPAGIAAREGTITRLDLLGPTVVAATNLSGKGRHLRVRGSADFIRVPEISTWGILLGLGGIFMAFIGLTNANVSLMFWGLVIAAWPAYKTFKIFEARKHRGILEGYITEVCQQGPAR